DVHHPGALEIALAPEVGGGRGQDLFDAGRPSDQLFVARHEQRRRAADVRRGHARAVLAGRVRVRDGRLDLLAGRDDVGLYPPVAGRAAAGEVADAVRVRLEAVRGADGDDEVGVAGIGDADAAIALGRRPLGRLVLDVALVAGRGHDDHAVVHQPL